MKAYVIRFMGMPYHVYVGHKGEALIHRDKLWREDGGGRRSDWTVDEVNCTLEAKESIKKLQDLARLDPDTIKITDKKTERILKNSINEARLIISKMVAKKMGGS